MRLRIKGIQPCISNVMTSKRQQSGIWCTKHASNEMELVYSNKVLTVYMVNGFGRGQIACFLVKNNFYLNFSQTPFHFRNLCIHLQPSET